MDNLPTAWLFLGGGGGKGGGGQRPETWLIALLQDWGRGGGGVQI